MKKSLLFITVLFLFASCKQVNISEEKSNVEAVVKNYYAALEKSDYDAVSSFCSPAFSGFEEGATFPDLKTFIEIMKSYEVQNCTITVNNLNTEVTNDMAFTVINADGVFTTKENSFTVHARENFVLRKIDNKWLIEYFHSTHLSDDPVLAKGSMLGFHVINEFFLAPGVTREQAEDYMINTYIPGFNKISPDIKLVALKSVRGNDKDKIGVAYFFASDEVRNRLWSAEGVYSPAGEEYFKKFDTLNAEAGKVYNFSSIVYNDWVVK